MLLLQDEDLAPPIGSFMDAVPHSAFIVIHSVLILAGYWLYRRTRISGFLLFILAELSYITYHAGLTHFLFAHLIAEVFDALALVLIAFGLASRAGVATPAGQSFVSGAGQHR